ncbi:MAG: type II toxin-antitoxin system PemK/MazF family toxin [Propionibacteriaceae bacterium]|nr:type II toxin-antitoxin system PemK/MazF family toxin [Propionibacteriaceae bacterium]
MIRGGIYQIDLGRPRGHEQGGHRFGVVVSPSDSVLTVATVVPTSTSAVATHFRPEITILGHSTRLLIDQMKAIDVRYIHDLVGIMGVDDLEALDLGISRYLGLYPRLVSKQG